MLPIFFCFRSYCQSKDSIAFAPALVSAGLNIVQFPQSNPSVFKRSIVILQADKTGLNFQHKVNPVFYFVLKNQITVSFTA